MSRSRCLVPAEKEKAKFCDRIPVAELTLASDRVLGYAQGSFGEQVAVNPATLIPIPPNCTYEQAAGIFLYVHCMLPC